MQFEDLPKIILNGITFILMGYNLPDKKKFNIGQRPTLKVTSNYKNPDFNPELRNELMLTYHLYLYQSETSLGFWRLGCITNWENQLYKGANDYIQQTFIHMELQKFINENFSKIKDIRFKNCHPEFTETQRKYYGDRNGFNNYEDSHFTICSDLSDYRRPSIGLTYYIKTSIDNPDRMVNIPTFSEYNNEQMGTKCGYFYKLRQSIPEYLKEISDKFSHDYILQTKSIRFLYNYTDNYVSVNKGVAVNLNIILNIFQCELVAKEISNPKLFLYYAIYKIVSNNELDKDTLLADNYYIPIYLTTNTNITPFGLYENYVLSGGFVCKIFEHSKQVRGKEGKILSNDHTYIGFMYNDLFPFNEIKSI